MGEPISDVESWRPEQEVVRDLCKLASLCDALGQSQKRDAALALALDLLDLDAR